MLNLAVRNTRKLIREKSKGENVRIGRYFTKKQTASLMANMFDIAPKDEISILDPGAGTGILSAALVERICAAGGVQIIHLTCYENDPEMIPMLEKNLDRIRKKCRREFGVKLIPTVNTENFIIDRRDSYTVSLFTTTSEKYDYIIANPPTELLEADSPEVLSMKNICSGATDIAYLFAAMSVFSLNEGGQMVANLPAAIATSAYCAKIRRYMFESAPLHALHLFTVAAKAEGAMPKKKKNLIMKLVKADAPETIAISSSTDDGSPEKTEFLPAVDYDFIVRDADCSLRLIASNEDLTLINKISSLPCTFESLGLKVRTGLVIESKCREQLRDMPEEGAIPLIHPQSIKFGQVAFPQKGLKNQFILPASPSMAQKNRNMLVIKRVPAKTDRHHLLCGIYMATQCPRNAYISTHNKLNFIVCEDSAKEMDTPLLYGLYVALTSDVYERYYRITTASSQVNASELATLPLPEASVLRSMGQKVLMTRQLGDKVCNVVIREALSIPKN